MTPNEGSLLIRGQDHVSLSLLHLQVLNTGHFSVLGDHSLNNVVHRIFFFQVLLLSLSFQLLTINDLLLDVVLVVSAVLETSSFSLPRDLILNLLGPQHNLVDLGVLFL